MHITEPERYITFKRNSGQVHQLDTFPDNESAIKSATALHDPDWDDGQYVEVWHFEENKYFGDKQTFSTESV